MVNNFGPLYLNVQQARLKLGDSWTVRKLRSGRYLVRTIRSGEMLCEPFPASLKGKLVAYYVASVMNGKVTDVFHFGSDMFEKT